MFTATQVGAKLRADHPIRGVKIARRFTRKSTFWGAEGLLDANTNLKSCSLTMLDEAIGSETDFAGWYRRES
jgi:hypothetical protein